ncbi:MAG: hypothetical protein CL565_02320 [Alphaproteobacteria bacterium]|nr:hypothetical protein [Alphaproteobacteria bacterium]
MKIKFDIECTPQEARAFMGLPDVAPMQEKFMEDIQQKLAQNIKDMDPEALAKTWVPIAMQNWTDVQKSFWGQMQATSSQPDKEGKDQ